MNNAEDHSIYIEVKVRKGTGETLALGGRRRRVRQRVPLAVT